MSEIEQLERILKSALLAGSPSLSRFLRYIVEETLAERSGAIREYTLGVQVFDRGGDFNPRLDPIVRVQARNLRARLAKYYEGQGAEDPIRIELPKGTYVPVFHRSAAEEAPELQPSEAGPVADAAVSAPAVASADAPAPEAAPSSIMPVPPPRSPVATPRGVERYLLAVVILLAILVGMAALVLTQVHAAAGAAISGPVARDHYIQGQNVLNHRTEVCQASWDCVRDTSGFDSLVHQSRLQG